MIHSTARYIDSDLPKRFVLVPVEDGSIEVTVAAQCVGYVCLEEEKWKACDEEGIVLDSDSDTIYAAVTLVFRAHNDKATYFA